MKNLKKCFAILLAMTMIFATTSIAFADAENDGNAPTNGTAINSTENLDLSDEKTTAPNQENVPTPVITPVPVADVTSIALKADEQYPFQTKEFGSVIKTYVSLRQCAELFNASIEWQENDQSIHIVQGNNYIRLVIGQPVFVVYGFDFSGKLIVESATEYSLITDEEKATLIDDGLTGNEITPILTEINGGATYLPIRAVAEALFGVKAPNEAETVAWVDGVTTFNVSNEKMVSGPWDDYLAERFRDGSITLPEIGTVRKIPTGSVEVNVFGNFEGADAAFGDGVTVTLNGKTQTAANGGVCNFADVEEGTYILTISNIPKNCTAKEVTVTVVGGQQTNAYVYLYKADAKDTTNNR